MNSIQSLRLILILSIASLATGLTLAQTASTSSRYTASPASPDGIGKRYMDREISGVMGWQGAPWLERQEREREERTDLLLKALALKPGMVVADIGAGGKEHNEKTDAAWDAAKKKVAESYKKK